MAVPSPHRAQITRLQAELTRVLNARDELIEKVEKGTLSPEQANDESRILQKIIDQHRADIEKHERRLDAESPEDARESSEPPSTDPAPSTNTATPPMKQESLLSTTDQLTILLGAIIIIAAVATIYRNHYQGDGVQFSMQPPPPQLQRATLQCRNKTKHPISLYTTENAPENLEKPNQAYRINLYLAHDNTQTFKLFPHTDTHWYFNGATLTQTGPIKIPPGITIELKLDVAAIRAEADSPTAFRIDCISGNRTLAYTASF